MVNFQDQLWPKGSPFAASIARRPPITRQISLRGSNPHDILLQATDQLSRGMLHMPNLRHPRRSPPNSSLQTPMGSTEDLDEEDIDAPPTLPGLGSTENKDVASIRPRVLYTIATDVMGVAERMDDPTSKEYWAKWADGVFMQMEMEAPPQSCWAYATAIGRGRCWLITGSARTEALEDQLDQSDNEDQEGHSEHVLSSSSAQEAREALNKGQSTNAFSRRRTGQDSTLIAVHSFSIVLFSH